MQNWAQYSSVKNCYLRYIIMEVSGECEALVHGTVPIFGLDKFNKLNLATGCDVPYSNAASRQLDLY